MYYASNIFYILALDVSKISIVLFIHRLTSRDTLLRRYCEVLLALLSISALSFVLVTSLQCDLSQPWIFIGRECTNWVGEITQTNGSHLTDNAQILRWQIHAVVECLYEAAIFAAPMWLVWKLQTSNSVKIDIVAPFALRLL